MGKKFRILSILLFVCGIANAQFFAPLKKPVAKIYTLNPKYRNQILPDSISVLSPTVAKIIAFRPVFNAISYTIPDNVAQAGFGGSVQWLHFDSPTQAYYADLCLNFLLYGGAQLVESQKAVYAAGVSVGFFNNLLAPGADYNFILKKPQLTLSANINFNNK